MFSKIPVKRLSLGAAGAIWLAIGSMQSANAASVKGSSPFSIAAPPSIDYDGAGKVKTKKSLGNAMTSALTTMIVAGAFANTALLIWDNNENGEGFTVVNRPDPDSPKIPTPALLPGLVALGLRLMHKRKSEQESALKEA